MQFAEFCEVNMMNSGHLWLTFPPHQGNQTVISHHCWFPPSQSLFLPPSPPAWAYQLKPPLCDQLTWWCPSARQRHAVQTLMTHCLHLLPSRLKTVIASCHLHSRKEQGCAKLMIKLRMTNCPSIIFSNSTSCGWWILHSPEKDRM